MKKGVTGSRKISDSHQTVIKRAVPVIVKLKQSKNVSRIVVGKIKNTRSKVPKLLSTVTGTSVKMTIKSQGEIQEFYIIGNNLEEVKQDINRLSY